MLLVVSCSAQTLRFEVASVKPHKISATEGQAPAPPPLSIQPSQVGVTIVAGTILDCIGWAYDLKAWQIQGPEWIATERFDIVAKASARAPAEQMKLMLQQLLTERFQLRMHHGRKEGPVMALVVARGGPKLQAATADSDKEPPKGKPLAPGAMRWSFQNASLDVLEKPLSTPDWNPVINMTGLTGRFDFTYERPARDPEHPAEWLGDVQRALQNQLGLTLTPRRALVDILIIDSGQKAPTEN